MADALATSITCLQAFIAVLEAHLLGRLHRHPILTEKHSESINFEERRHSMMDFHL